MFHLLSISSNYFLIGSANYKNFIYSSDFDLNEKYKAKDTPSVLNKLFENFKDKFIEAKNDPNIFITDFKCGEDEQGEPLRWTYKEMMNGKNGKYRFTDCLLQKSTMKLDMIVFINGVATEITDNYFLSIEGHKNFDDLSKKELIQKLIESYNELIDERKFFKTLKRLFSIQTLENHPSEKLIELFNSDLGRLYKTASDINTVIELLEQTFKTCPLEKIFNNLQIIKCFSSKVTSINIHFVSTEIDKICKLTSRIKIQNDLEKISNKLNANNHTLSKEKLVCPYCNRMVNLFTINRHFKSKKCQNLKELHFKVNPDKTEDEFTLYVNKLTQLALNPLLSDEEN